LRSSATAPPDAAAVVRVRKLLEEIYSENRPQLLTTTAGYFVEFNRGIPVQTNADGVAFPVSATVHAADRWTIAENPSAIVDMVRTARQLSGCTQVSIAPLALHYPHAAVPETFPAELVAPWLVASIAAAAVVQVEAITLAADVLDAMAALGQGGAALLQQLVQSSGARLLPLAFVNAPNLHVLAVQRGETSADVLLANLSDDPVTIPWESPQGRITQPREVLSGEHLATSREQYLTVPALAVLAATLDTSVTAASQHVQIAESHMQSARSGHD
jgi:hypothetical protein